MSQVQLHTSFMIDFIISNCLVWILIPGNQLKTTLKYSQKCVFISLHIKIYQNKTYQVFIHKIKLHLIKNKKKKKQDFGMCSLE